MLFCKLLEYIVDELFNIFSLIVEPASNVFWFILDELGRVFSEIYEKFKVLPYILLL